MFKIREKSKVDQMQTLKSSTFLLLIFSFLTSTKCGHENSNRIDHCIPRVCNSNEPISRFVQFPFLIRNETMPSFCGYPGFDLICNKDDKLLISLPYIGSFSIEGIDYINQELWLNDPDHCLPRKLISLNGSSFKGHNSPFSPLIEQKYWFYNCSIDFFNSTNNDPSVELIGCLSGPSYGVFGTRLRHIKGNSSSMCTRIGPIGVPVPYPREDPSFSLWDDIRLRWSQPNECGECYRRYGRCRMKANSNFEVECFDLPRHGLSRQAMVAIALAFATPLILVTICIIYFITKAIMYRRTHGSGVTPTPEVTQHSQRVTIQGLEKAIIESYPKLVIGSSRRLPKPDELHCPICLGEYLPKESLRTIPDCGHCFHADCIDEWLQLNASCPVCRNSPFTNPIELSE